MEQITLVENIFGKPPGWLMRWGITVILISLLCLLTMAGFIGYSDTLSGTAVVSAADAPVQTLAETGGEIEEVLKKDKDSVSLGEYVLSFRNTARWADVQLVEDVLTNNYAPDSLSAGLLLGDLSTSTHSWILADESYQHTLRHDISGKKIRALEKEITQLSALNNSVKRQLDIYRKEMGNAELEYKRQQKMLQEGNASQQQLEQSETNYLQARRQMENMATNVTNNLIRSQQLETQIVDVRKNSSDALQQSESQLSAAKEKVRTDIMAWKKRWLLASPATGQLDFGKALSAGVYVKPGEAVFSVVPQIKNGITLARAKVPAQGTGKLRSGQMAILSLSNYPESEYGTLTCTVTDISILPQEKDNYEVRIRLPDTWMTNQHKVIPKQQNLLGNVRIITQKKTILSRIFDPILQRLKG